MTEKDFTKILMDLSGDIGDIKGAVGLLSGKVDQSLELHKTCPARLGFDNLKDITSSFKRDKSAAIDKDSLIPNPRINTLLKAAAPYVWKGALIFGLAVGASVVARLGSSDMDQAPTMRAIQAVADTVGTTGLGVERIEKKQINDSDAGP